MAKKVLVISTSMRGNSNSEKLAEAFADGAKAAGNEVELVSLKNKTIAFCKGCLAADRSLHNQRRCERHYGQNAGGGRGCLGDAHLLL